NARAKMPPASPKPMTEMRGRLMLDSAVTRRLLRIACGGPSTGALRAPSTPCGRGWGPPRQRREGEGAEPKRPSNMPPDGARRLDHQPQLGDLVVIGDVVAADRTGKAALRADGEVLHRHEARRLVEPAAQH